MIFNQNALDLFSSILLIATYGAKLANIPLVGSVGYGLMNSLRRRRRRRCCRKPTAHALQHSFARRLGRLLAVPVVPQREHSLVRHPRVQSQPDARHRRAISQSIAKLTSYYKPYDTIGYIYVCSRQFRLV